jgi:hypothetical protein
VKAYGAGVYCSAPGNLIVHNCTIAENNGGSGSGAGVYSDGDVVVHVIHSIVYLNLP